MALLISALFGTAVVGILDPMSLSVRSLGLAFLPGFNYGMNALLDLLYRSEVGAFRLAADTLHFLLKDTLLSYRQHHVRQAFVLGLIFIIILALNFPDHAFLVQGDLSSGCAARRDVALVDSRPGEATRPLRQLRPLPAPLSGR